MDFSDLSSMLEDSTYFRYNDVYLPHDSISDKLFYLQGSFESNDYYDDSSSDKLSIFEDLLNTSGSNVINVADKNKDLKVRSNSNSILRNRKSELFSDSPANKKKKKKERKNSNTDSTSSFKNNDFSPKKSSDDIDLSLDNFSDIKNLSRVKFSNDVDFLLEKSSINASSNGDNSLNASTGAIVDPLLSDINSSSIDIFSPAKISERNYIVESKSLNVSPIHDRSPKNNDKTSKLLPTQSESDFYVLSHKNSANNDVSKNDDLFIDMLPGDIKIKDVLNREESNLKTDSTVNNLKDILKLYNL